MPLGYHDGPRLVKVPGNVTWWHTTGLQPNSIYLVSLIAINDVGASRPSPRLRLTTDQEPPEGTATDIRAISNASQSILVTWKVHLLLHLIWILFTFFSGPWPVNFKKGGEESIVLFFLSNKIRLYVNTKCLHYNYMYTCVMYILDFSYLIHSQIFLSFDLKY